MSKFKKVDEAVSKRVLGGKLTATCHTYDNNGRVHYSGSYTGKSNTNWNNIHAQCRIWSNENHGNNWTRYEGYVTNDGKGPSGSYNGNR